MIKYWLKILSFIASANDFMHYEYLLLRRKAGLNKEQTEHEQHQKKLDVGAFIFDHILDNYGWHLFTYKHIMFQFHYL
jgi:hypothetical protein